MPYTSSQMVFQLMSLMRRFFVQWCEAQCAQRHHTPGYTPCPDAFTGAFQLSEPCHRQNIAWHRREKGILCRGGVCSPFPETVTHWRSCWCTHSRVTESPGCTSGGPLPTASVKCRGVLPLPNEWHIPGIAFQHWCGWSHTASWYANLSLWWIRHVATPPLDTSIWLRSNVASVIQSRSRTSQHVSTLQTAHAVD